tara:strand:- start:36 stop:305 length:270 start_codon:yes stop_codon:yes gene_type:complete
MNKNYEKINNSRKIRSKNTGRFRYGLNMTVSFETYQDLLDIKNQNNIRSLPKTIEFLVNKHLNYVKDLEQFKVPYTGGDSALNPHETED